jgi:Neuraminidase (sialidase)
MSPLKPIIHIATLVTGIALAHASQAEEQDLRLITTGNKIASKTYSDQPYIVINKDGHWICTLTTGDGHEGSGGQHIISTLSKDQGKTWSAPVAIEPPTGPVASWVTPLLTPSGRLYAFYTYNGDEISTMPGQKRRIRNDMLGWYCFKYSDDNGKTWSRRYRIPVRTTAADRANQWKGEVVVFWGIDKPKIHDDGVRFAFTKLGRYMLDNGEGWMLYSDNILTETDPEKINWELLPDGEHGIRHKDYGSVQEEHNHVEIDGKQLYLVYRTTRGHPAHTYSTDGGHNWDTPEYMTYSPGGRKLKTRAPVRNSGTAKTESTSSGSTTIADGVFETVTRPGSSAGIVRDGKMHWSSPRLCSTVMIFPTILDG